MRLHLVSARAKYDFQNKANWTLIAGYALSHIFLTTEQLDKGKLCVQTWKTMPLPKAGSRSQVKLQSNSGWFLLCEGAVRGSDYRQAELQWLVPAL